MNPKYPVYIISKNRHESRPTSKIFEKINVPYYIVVEENQYEDYSSVIKKDKILILPERYLYEYDTFDELGRTKSTGAGAARNFCWDHSIENGFKWHWVFDDNVSCFYRLNKNRRLPVGDGAIFKVMEEFVERYTNIAIAGPNYLSYAPDRNALPPFILNWRIYSMLLIRNDIPYRWRGRYNEDTDLSLRVLKDGWCTIQFNAFLGDKGTTQTLQGGNTDDFYAQEGTKNKSEMLVKMHPDVAKVIVAHDRWHHKVDYSSFKKNRLLKKEGLEIPEGVNNYGMELIRL
jgi:hypothetical protein